MSNRLKVLLAIITLCLLVLGLSLYLKGDSNETVYGQSEQLECIKVIPEGIIHPLFDRKYPVKQFISWVAENLQYPQCDSITNQKVIVSFIIDKKGNLGNIQIISAPEDISFSNEIIRVLQMSPKWEPAKKKDGTPVSIQYELPVAFKPSK